MLPFTALLGLMSAHIGVRAVNITVPASPGSALAVEGNFLGISIELSFLDQYLGNDSQSIPQPMVNYLSALRDRTGPLVPLRIRLGGNSLDSSNFIRETNSPMVQLTNPDANVNDQPVNYGSEVFKALKSAVATVGGIEYLIGLKLGDPSDLSVAVVAGEAQNILGNDLDAFLIGNEPDLYTDHNKRPNLVNYTVVDYLNEWGAVSGHLADTSAGNMLEKYQQHLGGPTVCCHWDLATLLQQGYLEKFNTVLKYISLQHYPQNRCFDGKYRYDIRYYLNHGNVYELAQWQKHGIDVALAANGTQKVPKVVMSEFNSASCGGTPDSDAFAVGSLWTLDYALQMAATGYSAAYLHTREQGILYNLFDPPKGVDGNSGPWKTNAAYYAVLSATEVLQAPGGNIVQDLDFARQTNNSRATIAGYGVYDGKTTALYRIALFNYANTSSEAVEFTLAKEVFGGSSGKKAVTVKYLAAPSVIERTKISWGGKTLDGVADGLLADSTSTDAGVKNIVLDCENGCTVNVPGSAMGLVYVGGQQEAYTVARTPVLKRNSSGEGSSVVERFSSWSWTFGVLFASMHFVV